MMYIAMYHRVFTIPDGHLEARERGYVDARTSCARWRRWKKKLSKTHGKYEQKIPRHSLRPFSHSLRDLVLCSNTLLRRAFYISDRSVEAT